ncbi:hypothetical protein B2G71_05475 [Novosphingobium sp. PC22D]|uniref:hypothetical protein n=1 Tax=Novosphingobium sp. PC22D TaxID=1962403 RepID=UPI000BFACBCF|nr:hypothetical protein [Novosphingobium sp. PC22D]PEQ13766.1 hypothetical protein B2G71_05475 [Novosphingobium sp. PC22D]
MFARPVLLLLLGLVLSPLGSSAAIARDSLGLYSDWGAFRDPMVPRCYAIAKAQPSNRRRDYQPYASVGTWPKRGVRNQIHFRVSRKLADAPRIDLRVGDERFELTGGGGDAWPPDDRTNAAIIAAIRSAPTMTVRATDETGRRFHDTWTLPGAASAIDAAALGCAKAR